MNENDEKTDLAFIRKEVLGLIAGAKLRQDTAERSIQKLEAAVEDFRQNAAGAVAREIGEFLQKTASESLEAMRQGVREMTEAAAEGAKVKHALDGAEEAFKAFARQTPAAIARRLEGEILKASENATGGVKAAAERAAGDVREGIESQIRNYRDVLKTGEDTANALKELFKGIRASAVLVSVAVATVICLTAFMVSYKGLQQQRDAVQSLKEEARQLEKDIRDLRGKAYGIFLESRDGKNYIGLTEDFGCTLGTVKAEKNGDHLFEIVPRGGAARGK
jgi:archaellum component FlaC